MDTDSDEEKPVFWAGSSLDDIREFPKSARRDAGFELSLVQKGEQPTDFKYMNSVGSGVYEIRVRGEDSDQYRVMYIAKYEEAVFVLHAFQKTSSETEKRDIDLAKDRLKGVKQYVRSSKKTQ
ncbi:phage-related protein [Salinibacter ruber]|jgi:phage-related protein|uniref:type II toxin-antitoxin system RelE/ParE family toxin n=1 Tax=Salinibacter ruber TaxID=146919 RepID=UPI0021687A79|nr:type II toxin-antitoxin system RelE/ParE family toxin [Salinibacter ruber]MCS3666414.1 phage-related protein [Salinibacter ruber]